MLLRGGDGVPDGFGDVVGLYPSAVIAGVGVEEQVLLLPAGDVDRIVAGLDPRLGEAAPLRFGRGALGRVVCGDEVGRTPSASANMP
jgi:hypothetical protein